MYLIERAKLERSIKLSGSVSIVAKVSAVIVQLISVPLITSSYDKESLSIWLLAATATGIIQVVDLGVGSANIGLAAKVYARDGLAGVRSLLRSSLLLTSLFSLAVAAAAWLILNYYIDLDSAALKQSIYFFLPVALANLPAFSASQICFGLHKGQWLGFAQLAGQFVYFIALVVGVKSGWSVPYLLLVCYAILALFNVFVVCKISQFVGVTFNSLNLFKFRFNSSIVTLKELLVVSFPFLIVQVSTAISYNLDAFLIARYVDMESVSEFLLTQKLFFLPGIVIGSFLGAVWPTFSFAFENRDYAWIQRIFRQALLFACLFAMLSSIVLYIGAPFFFAYWTNGKVMPGKVLLMCFFLWALLNAIGGVQATFLNGIGKVKIQATLGSVAAIINFSLSFYLVKTVGVIGPILASLITLLILYSVYAIVINKKLKQMVRGE